MESNELKHYGVQGMKWGVRRYQNKDGSLTTAGKKRYSGDSKIEVKRTLPGKTSAKNKTATKKPVEEEKPKKKSLSEMSDDEIQKAIDRMRLEKTYKELATTVNPQKSTRGKDFALRCAEKIGENVVVNLGTQAANHIVGEAVNKAFGVKSDDAAKRVVNPQKGQTDKK